MRLTAADILDQGDASGRPRARGSTTLHISINIRSEQDRRTSSCRARDYSVFLPAEINIELEGDGDIGPSATVNGIRGSVCGAGEQATYYAASVDGRCTTTTARHRYEGRTYSDSLSGRRVGWDIKSCPE